MAVSALRTALSAIGNAEAPDADTEAASASAGSAHFAGAAAGLDAGETQHRGLSSAHVDQVVPTEISDSQDTKLVTESSALPRPLKSRQTQMRCPVDSPLVLPTGLVWSSRAVG